MKSRNCKVKHCQNNYKKIQVIVNINRSVIRLLDILLLEIKNNGFIQYMKRLFVFYENKSNLIFIFSNDHEKRCLKILDLYNRFAVLSAQTFNSKPRVQ